MAKRQTRTGIMLARKYEERLIEKWRSAYFQPKLDGFRCRAEYTVRSGVTLYSSSGAEIRTLPTLQRDLNNFMFRQDYGYMHFDGELMLPGGKFNELSSVVKRSNPHPREAEVYYVIFDFVEFGIPGFTAPQRYRAACLRNLDQAFSEDFGRGYPGRFACLETSHGPISHDVVGEYMQEFVERGFEGVILRHPDADYEATAPKRSNYLLKLKPTKSLWFRVVGWKQLIGEDGEHRAEVGSLTCRTKDGEEFSVGSGPYFTRRQRIELFEETLPAWINVRFQELTERGVPRFPIAAEATYVDRKET